MEPKFTKGFVRQTVAGDGEPVYMLMMIVRGPLPEGISTETVFVGNVVFDGQTATVSVERTQKTDEFSGLRADQIMCAL